ncbi:MAG: hypothetical protein JNL32_08550 [Candidatus Kapabacteria bacterium]|nr:hypothetical protein [Candidatus Kapabacteria bacterium]
MTRGIETDTHHAADVYRGAKINFIEIESQEKFIGVHNSTCARRDTMWSMRFMHALLLNPGYDHSQQSISIFVSTA